MYWVFLLLGIALWAGAHLFKRVWPVRRAALGNAGKGMVAGLLILSILLMWLGYRNLDDVQIWQPPAFLVHLNNLLILVAIYLMSPAGKRGRLLRRVRHPMLTGFGLWALAHLLVNGNLAAVVLFGGLLGWAMLAARMINIAEPGWQARTDGTYAKDAMFVTGSILLLLVIGHIHLWLGVSPFPG